MLINPSINFLLSIHGTDPESENENRKFSCFTIIKDDIFYLSIDYRVHHRNPNVYGMGAS